MRLIDEIRLTLLQDYDILNHYFLPRSCDADCEYLIVKHKKTGREYKVSVEDWEEDD